MKNKNIEMLCLYLFLSERFALLKTQVISLCIKQFLRLNIRKNTMFEISLHIERLADVQRGVLYIVFYFSEIFKTISIYVQLKEIHSWA